MVIDMAYIVLIREGIPQPLGQQLGVYATRDHHSIGLLSVTTCTTCFLEVFLKRRRNCQVNNQTYIGLVDAHAEGICGDHDTHLIPHPPCLPKLSLLIGQPCMIVGSTYAVGEEFVSDLACQLSVSAVNNR